MCRALHNRLATGFLTELRLRWSIVRTHVTAHATISYSGSTTWHSFSQLSFTSYIYQILGFSKESTWIDVYRNFLCQAPRFRRWWERGGCRLRCYIRPRCLNEPAGYKDERLYEQPTSFEKALLYSSIGIHVLNISHIGYVLCSKPTPLRIRWRDCDVFICIKLVANLQCKCDHPYNEYDRNLTLMLWSSTCVSMTEYF